MTVHAPASHAWAWGHGVFWAPAGRFIEGEDAGSMGPKIAIIGGGIGGLTAAVALARRSLAAEVYEQAPALEEVGAGAGPRQSQLAFHDRL